MIVGVVAVTSAVVLLMLLGVVVRRVARRTRERRLRRLSARHRPLLLVLVAGDPDEAREAARVIAALDRASWRALEPAVVGLLAKVRGEGRDEVVRLLHERGVVAAARRDLRRRSPVRRAAAADVLGRTQAPGTVRSLVRLLDDRDGDVRQVAARSLGRIGSPVAVRSLLSALAGGRLPPTTVAQALLRIGMAGAPELVDAVDDPAATVRATVVVVLGRLGVAGAGPALGARLRHDPATEVRCHAAAALGALGMPGAAPDLVAATGSASPSALRIAATRALGDLGAASTGPVLTDLFDDVDARVASEASAAHARLGVSDDVPTRSAPVLVSVR